MVKNLRCNKIATNIDELSDLKRERRFAALYTSFGWWIQTKTISGEQFSNVAARCAIATFSTYRFDMMFVCMLFGFVRA